MREISDCMRYFGEIVARTLEQNIVITDFGDRDLLDFEVPGLAGRQVDRNL